MKLHFVMNSYIRCYAVMGNGSSDDVKYDEVLVQCAKINPKSDENQKQNKANSIHKF